jgi:hypothetical protein
MLDGERVGSSEGDELGEIERAVGAAGDLHGVVVVERAQENVVEVLRGVVVDVVRRDDDVDLLACRDSRREVEQGGGRVCRALGDVVGVGRAADVLLVPAKAKKSA